MKILIDADGCPVVKQATQIAKENNIEVAIFCVIAFPPFDSTIAASP